MSHPDGGSGLPPSWLSNITNLMRDHRRAQGETQESFALKHGYSDRKYRAMESGGKISTADMYALANQLNMSPSAYAQFFFLVTGDAPTRGLTVDESRTVGEGMKCVTAEWAKVHVHRQVDPAVLVDGCWNVVHFNTAWASIFEAVRPHPYDHPLVNPLKFCLFHPQAPHFLLHWQERWLITALSQFAYQYFVNQDNAELREIRDRIRGNDLLEGIYSHRIGNELADRGIDRLSDGDVEERPLLLPGRGEQTVLVTTGHPWFGRHYGYEVVTFSHPNGVQPLLTPLPAPATGDRTRPEPPTHSTAPPEEQNAAAADPAPPNRHSPEFALTVGQLLTKYRKKIGLSQEVFTRSAELPISDGTYVKYERDKQLPPKEYHDELSQALRMPPSVKQLLYSLTAQAEPPTLSVRAASETERRTRRWVSVHLEDRRQKSPSVLMDGAWQVKFCNTAYRELFAHVPPDPRNHPMVNPFRYVVFHQDAKVSLADWYDIWLTPWLVELGSALLWQEHRGAHHPEHRALYDEIEKDPFLRETFNDRVMRDLRGGGATIGFESDGDIRGMLLPVQQPDGTFTRQYTPMLVTAGVPSHLKQTGELFTTMTPL
ncbi:hypothetical protein ACFY0Z_30935 [Streptomyces kronopolitis]|uniref:hypothetical protein n=1 Tax=Streptomyces kronopolitis TaxID=1612435 RepID=UPI0036B08E19